MNQKSHDSTKCIDGAFMVQVLMNVFYLLQFRIAKIHTIETVSYLVVWSGTVSGTPLVHQRILAH